MNVSRLEQEFEYVRMLGIGEFGTVFAYKHRLGMVPFRTSLYAELLTYSDGAIYAIKRSNKPIAGLAEELVSLSL